jgi:hypothetical protein
MSILNFFIIIIIIIVIIVIVIIFKNNNNNDYLMIENIIDYDYINTDVNIYVDVYKINNNNNNDIVKVKNILYNHNNNYNNSKSYYYILDCTCTAFGHWVFETFIYIDILKQLNKNNSNIKILTKNDKKYVKSLLNFFNINNEIVYKVNNYNNITYSPLVLSLNYTLKNPKTDTYYNYHLNKYINYIKNNIINIPYNNKCVYLPRNDIDNFSPNDRKIINQDDIKKIVVNNGGIVLDTYYLNNIKYQLSIINNSNIIILDYGSCFMFNCIFLENKKIYLINYENHFLEVKINPYVNYNLSIIFKNNQVIPLDNTNLDNINKIFL